MQQSDPDSVRARQRAQWSAAAPGWLADRDEVAGPARAVTDALLAGARIAEGHAVLDVACGGGDPALTIARVVGPSGRVVGLDLTPAMVEGARAAACGAGLSNVAFRAIDDECVTGVAEASIDAVTSRFGLMFMANPVAAAGSWRNALRPGGRIAVSTWEAFAPISFVLAIVGRHVDLPATDPDAPGILALRTPERLGAVLRDAGYTDTAVERVRTPVFESAEPERWWDVMTRSAGPLVVLFASLPADKRAAIRADGISALRERHPSGIVEEFGDALIGSATNPG